MGVPIVHGIDGWVKFYHPHNQRVVIKEDGSADFRNLEKFISIKKAEKLQPYLREFQANPERMFLELS